MNLETSDPRRPSDSRRSEDVAGAVRTARTVGIVFVAVLGMGFTVWALTEYFASRSDVTPLSGVGPASAQAPTGGGCTAVEAAPGMLNVHVVVRLRGKGGEDMPIGSSLPTHVALKLLGEDDRPYEARFDRVGVWLMEVPPGEYRVPPEQEDMGEWKWTLTGANVDKAEAGYTVKFEAGSIPPRLELLLY